MKRTWSLCNEGLIAGTGWRQAPAWRVSPILCELTDEHEETVTKASDNKIRDLSHNSRFSVLSPSRIEGVVNEANGLITQSKGSTAEWSRSSNGALLPPGTVEVMVCLN